MAEMLSPGVFVQEVDASTVAPVVSNSFAAFAGKFSQGPIEKYTLITSVDDLISFYGLPTDANYNDWYQAYNFLQYGNKLYIARAEDTTVESLNVNGGETNVSIDPETTAATTETDQTSFEVQVGAGTGFSVDDVITVGTSSTQYTVTDVTSDTISVTPNISVSTGDAIYIISNIVDSATIPVGLSSGFAIGDLVMITEPTNDVNTPVEEGEVYQITDIPNGTSIVVDRTTEGEILPTNEVYKVSSAFNAGAVAVKAGGSLGDYELTLVKNDDDFETKNDSGLLNKTDHLKFIAKNPGVWGEQITVSIANGDDFGSDLEAIPGVDLDGLFEYFPDASAKEIGIVVSMGGAVVETFLVSLDSTAKDYLGKSKYIEDVINAQSDYIFVTDSTDGTVESYLNTSAIDFEKGVSANTTAASLLTAYELWSNKELVDIDIVIANEIDGGASVKSLVESRLDCIGFIGAVYGDVVGKKAASAVGNLVDWRKTGDLNFNNMFLVACGNYKYQYDRYNDKNRWVNVAGDIAGLRAQTSTNRASWWASAGLERGQLKNVKKLAFNANSGQRDILYKNGINPIVSFPGQGTVMWGQKTLLDKPSSFDRVNVRGLFNTVERSLSKMAKYQVMEFNDSFTRNRIVSMIKPFLSSVQAGRGIQDFLVICDTSNNTPAVISANQLVVDVYIKPTYAAEFILLRFTNAGTNSFAQVIGG